MDGPDEHCLTNLFQSDFVLTEGQDSEHETLWFRRITETQFEADSKRRPHTPSDGNGGYTRVSRDK